MQGWRYALGNCALFINYILLLQHKYAALHTQRQVESTFLVTANNASMQGGFMRWLPCFVYSISVATIQLLGDAISRPHI